MGEVRGLVQSGLEMLNQSVRPTSSDWSEVVMLADAERRSQEEYRDRLYCMAQIIGERLVPGLDNEVTNIHEASNTFSAALAGSNKQSVLLLAEKSYDLVEYSLGEHQMVAAISNSIANGVQLARPYEACSTSILNVARTGLEHAGNKIDAHALVRSHAEDFFREF